MKKFSNLKISRFQNFQGSVHLPGSKSIANRVLLASALCQGKTHIQNLPQARDIEILIDALSKLGVVCNPSSSAHSYDIENSQAIPFQKKKLSLYLENAGTAMRPLTAILSAGEGHYLLEGSARMYQRPILDLVEALQKMGVSIQCSPQGCPPVEIQAKTLKGGRVDLSAKHSSQYVSALLFVAPLAQEDVHLHLFDKPVSEPYIDLSIDVLQKFKIQIEKRSSQEYFIPAPQIFSSLQDIYIEGDATAASYFLGAGALPGCGPVTVHSLGKNSKQGDIGFVKILERMGAKVEYGEKQISVQGPPRQEHLRALDVDMNDMPDAAMTLAVLALYANGPTKIRGIANLRLKESERIKALRMELVKVGAIIEEETSSLCITPPKELRKVSIKTYEDHRMAMAFSLLSYGTDVEIQDYNCVEKTYRNFFDDFLPMCIR